MPADRGALVRVLEGARDRGFLGPGPVERHIELASAFARAIDGIPPGSLVVDLGSGAGMPGLVLALERPDLRFVLLDAHRARCEAAAGAVATLGVAGRVVVRCERAERAGRDPDLRGRAAAVVARGFASPAVTAECGAPLLAERGILVVSEPPAADRVWPSDGLAELGLADEGIVRGEVGSTRVLRSVAPCPARYPRRTGVPAKRPLFHVEHPVVEGS